MKMLTITIIGCIGLELTKEDKPLFQMSKLVKLICLTVLQLVHINDEKCFYKVRKLSIP